jgi:hypothetical protein
MRISIPEPDVADALSAIWVILHHKVKEKSTAYVPAMFWTICASTLNGSEPHCVFPFQKSPFPPPLCLAAINSLETGRESGRGEREPSPLGAGP